MVVDDSALCQALVVVASRCWAVECGWIGGNRTGKGRGGAVFGIWTVSCINARAGSCGDGNRAGRGTINAGESDGGDDGGEECQYPAPLHRQGPFRPQFLIR